MARRGPPRSLPCRCSGLARCSTCGYTLRVILLKLCTIGNSVGLVLPKEVLAHLKAQEGDTIWVTEALDGSLRMSPTSPEVTPQLEAAQDLVRRYRNALRELAT